MKREGGSAFLSPKYIMIGEQNGMVIVVFLPVGARTNLNQDYTFGRQDAQPYASNRIANL